MGRLGRNGPGRGGKGAESSIGTGKRPSSGGWPERVRSATGVRANVTAPRCWPVALTGWGLKYVSERRHRPAAPNPATKTVDRAVLADVNADHRPERRLGDHSHAQL